MATKEETIFIAEIGTGLAAEAATVLLAMNEKKVYAIENVISEMKQTNPSFALRMTMMLGITWPRRNFCAAQ
jgi:hypothetical protein